MSGQGPVGKGEIGGHTASFSKKRTRFLGMSPHGEIAFPDAENLPDVLGLSIRNGVPQEVGPSINPGSGSIRHRFRIRSRFLRADVAYPHRTVCHNRLGLPDLGPHPHRRGASANRGLLYDGPSRAPSFVRRCGPCNSYGRHHAFALSNHDGLELPRRAPGLPCETAPIAAGCAVVPQEQSGVGRNPEPFPPLRPMRKLGWTTITIP